MTRNANSYKYFYSGYGIGFDTRRTFSLSDGSEFGKNMMIFGDDTSSSVHADHKTKNILILGKSPSDGLHDMTLTAEAEFSINFSEQQDKFCLSLHYKGSNSYLFDNEGKFNQFKGKGSN